MIDNMKTRHHHEHGILRNPDAEMVLDKQTGLAVAYQEARTANGLPTEWECCRPARGR